jgi:hypothetical protein
MANYRVKSHVVTGARILRTEPIYDHGAMVAPDKGLMLRLADGTVEKWVADKSGVIPQIDDFLVRDPELHCTVVVPVEKFNELFGETV